MSYDLRVMSYAFVGAENFLPYLYEFVIVN